MKLEISLDDLDLDLDFSPEVLAQKAVAKETWLPTARVLVVEITTCSCGQQFLAPAAKDLLLRFQNQRTGSIWERHEPGDWHQLPLERRELHKHCQVCPKCVSEETSTQRSMELPTNVH